MTITTPCPDGLHALFDDRADARVRMVRQRAKLAFLTTRAFSGVEPRDYQIAA